MTGMIRHNENRRCTNGHQPYTKKHETQRTVSVSSRITVTAADGVWFGLGLGLGFEFCLSYVTFGFRLSWHPAAYSGILRHPTAYSGIRQLRLNMRLFAMVCHRIYGKAIVCYRSYSKANVCHRSYSKAIVCYCVYGKANACQQSFIHSAGKKTEAAVWAASVGIAYSISGGRFPYPFQRNRTSPASSWR